MKRTTDFLFTVITMLLATLMTAVLPTEMDAAIYEDTVRLHILASSDSAADQELKYKIRDRLLTKYGAMLSDSSDPTAAKERIGALIEEIEESVNGWIKEYGYEYTSSVTLGTEWYDTRVYESFTLPRGYYTSLCVRLGEAEGQNWWCVLFPPLCLNTAGEPEQEKITVGFTPDQIKVLTDSDKPKYRLRFKLLELLGSIFS